MNEITPAHYDRIEHPKLCDADDFWGQVRRTVGGKPISQTQINIIISTIRQNLCFQPKDVMLDLCCGNGRLGFEFFNEINAYLGVDLSSTLIEIANKNFAQPPTHNFRLSEVFSYLCDEPNPDIFTKVLWYSSCQYFSDSDFASALQKLSERFNNIQFLFLGSLPDASRAYNFYRNGEKKPLDDHTSSIGRWFECCDLKKLASDCGWNVEIKDMPNDFYQASFRFNALLTRA